MSHSVFKYPIGVGPHEIQMPKGAEILHADVQGIHVMDEHAITPVIWARIDRSAPMVARFLVVCGTGDDCPDPDKGKYVGTFFTGPLVWHVFDMGELRV